MCTLSQEEVDSMLTNALEFLAIDDHKDWNYSTVPEDRGMRIPRILHHIFLDGEEEYFKHVPRPNCNHLSH